MFHISIVTDADNDEVRCRWASGYGECGDICGSKGIPNAWMYFVSPTYSVRGPSLPNPWSRYKIMLLESENFPAA